MIHHPQVSSSDRGKPTRRAFLRTSGTAAAATALAGSVIPRVHAAEENTIRLALIGCGGRGSGAVRDALDASDGPIALHAMADVMGRAAVHSGNITRWEQACASEFQWCPGADQMDYDTPPPVQADEQGRYPCPSPGFWTEL